MDFGRGRESYFRILPYVNLLSAGILDAEKYFIVKK